MPGGAQGLDRYAYGNNSPVNYVDPSGHACTKATYDSHGGPITDDQCEQKPSRVTTSPQPEVSLDPLGEGVAELFALFLATPGIWQALIADGCDPLVVFVAFMLNRESQSLWQEDHIEFSGWGSGEERDGKESFKQASNHWLWGWVEDVYHVTFGSLSQQSQQNAVFNWLGQMESVEGVVLSSQGLRKEVDKKTGEVSFPTDSTYIDLAPADRLRKVLGQYRFNYELMAIAEYALSNPTTGYWTWGNGEIPSNALYSFGNSFYIIDYYK